MISVLSGLDAFARAWEAVSAELLATKEPWNFAKKAPKGATAKIVQIETAAMFVTVAHRALNTRLFERSSLTGVYLDGELSPHRMTSDKLTPRARELAVKRINKAITDYLKAFVHFGLFEATEKKHVYRLTNLGVSEYPTMSDLQRRVFVWAVTIPLVSSIVLALSGSAWCLPAGVILR